MEAKVKQILAQILEIEVDDIDNDTSPDILSQWDSIQHLNIVASLEDEFGVRFSSDDILEMLNVGLIIHILESKLKKTNYERS